MLRDIAWRINDRIGERRQSNAAEIGVAADPRSQIEPPDGELPSLPPTLEIRSLYEAAAEDSVQIRHLDYKRDSLQDIFLKAMEQG